MHALSSAAVAVAVTRGCSRGELERCGCDRKVRGVSPEGESGVWASDPLSTLVSRHRSICLSLLLSAHNWKCADAVNIFLSVLQDSSGLGAVITFHMVWPSPKPSWMRQSVPRGCRQGDPS